MLGWLMIDPEIGSMVHRSSERGPMPTRGMQPPVVVRIRDTILGFVVLWLEGHLEPNCHFAFLNNP